VITVYNFCPPQLDQAWYSAYGSQIDFRNFGFTGLHDAVGSLPVSNSPQSFKRFQGIELRHEGSEYYVRVYTLVVDEAIRQKWGMGANSRPRPCPPADIAAKSGPADKQRLLLMQQMLQMHMQFAAMAGAASVQSQASASPPMTPYQLQQHQTMRMMGLGGAALVSGIPDSSLLTTESSNRRSGGGGGLQGYKKGRQGNSWGREK